MLEFNDKKRAQSLMDAKVKMMVGRICAMWDNMDDLQRLFPVGLGKIKQTNHINPVFAYKLIRNSNNVIEIWHVDQEAMVNDRLLCEVTQVLDKKAN